MLKCFPFAYHNLQEDDYCHVSIGKPSVRTFRKTDTAATLPRPKPSPASSQFLLTFKPKNTRHIEKQEALRKAAGLISAHQGPELADRYTRFPRSLSQVSDPPGHRIDNMSRVRIHWAGGGGTSSAGGVNPSSGGADNFINKPPRGWLHPDQEIRDGGICYGIRYVGCLEVNTSMKSLDFDTRSQIAKECINRVCEAAGLKTVDKKRKVDKRISRMLAEKPNMDFAGSNVNLTITSSYLSLIVMESGEVVVNHEMPNISFASGGDADTLDFIAYVAKDQRYGRACFVLECGGGLAQEVITTIGQAFELRFKEFLRRAPRSINIQDGQRMENSVINGSRSASTDDPEYYNDLPGKIPPDGPPPVPPLPDYHTATQNGAMAPLQYAAIKEPTPSSAPKSSAVTEEKENTTSDNLIDFGPEGSVAVLPKRPEPEYVNTTLCMGNKVGSDIPPASSNHSPTPSLLPPREPPVSRDPFDMQPFDSNLPSNQYPLPPPPPRHGPLPYNKSTVQSVPKTVSPASLKAALQQEEWFHGPISRKDSEALVVHDGDFLVRESQGSPGQYVLTGMRSGQRKHLLLVDPEGVVRTKDRTFESVSHLINYHRDNGLPIISAESALLLRTSIPRTKSVR
ncbi:SHC-transforming protein 1-like isoform X1 [Limulus polyphemus]|uniref:SHC-transforming protein 1-like isoform X1 n=2 Tax=Limulus polyphemus TaxID=6850 RepID=A0ABM1B5W0_LIMPO|nr:SHC-transforming protein 1-like isoform X1 [Limulus polyphemus]